jgi:hypothetical protein
MGMDADFISLAVSPSWHESQLLLVPATVAVRLCREGWYQEVPCEHAAAYVDALAQRDIASIRAFVARSRLAAFPLSMLNDHRVLALLMSAIRARDLAVVRQCEVAPAERDDTGEERQLVKQVESKVPRGLSLDGHTYRLVAGADLARLSNRDGYEVVKHDEATEVLGGIARQPAGAHDLAPLLGEAKCKLAADWRSPSTPNGLVLLRRIKVVAAVAINEGVPITPSQMREQLAPSDVSLEVVVLGVSDKQAQRIQYTIESSDGDIHEGRLPAAAKTTITKSRKGTAYVTVAWAKPPVSPAP